MPVYAFKCKACGLHYEVYSHPTVVSLLEGGCDVCRRGPVVRDYAAEAVGLTGMVTMKREREAGGRKAVRDLFLPSAKDFAGPSDPDGAKGVRAWNEEHEPRAGNKNPLRPEAP